MSSRLRNSEHGLDALIRPLAGRVCQSLIVVSNCIPGSPQAQVASEISRSSCRAFTVSRVSPELTALSGQSPSASAARMKSSLARTELFAFWN